MHNAESCVKITSSEQHTGFCKIPSQFFLLVCFFTMLLSYYLTKTFYLLSETEERVE